MDFCYVLVVFSTLILVFPSLLSLSFFILLCFSPYISFSSFLSSLLSLPLTCRELNHKCTAVEHCTVWERAALLLLREALHASSMPLFFFFVLFFFPSLFFSFFSAHKKQQWVLLESQTKSDTPVSILRHLPLTVSIHVKSVIFFHRSAASVLERWYCTSLPYSKFSQFLREIEPEGIARSCWISGCSSPEGDWALEQAPQRSRHGTNLAGILEVSKQCTQTHGLIFGWSYVEPQVWLDDPYRSLPTWDILQFCYFGLSTVLWLIEI